MKDRTGTANERIGQQAVDLALARKQRDDLLEALEEIVRHSRHPNGWVCSACIGAAAAIEKAEGS